MVLLAGIMFSIFFVEVHKFHVKWKLNFRPFNCASCLSAWVTLGLYFVPLEAVTPIGLMFTAGVLAPVGTMLMNYLWNKSIK
jgi:Na+/melibiose symporter-like transporter